MNIDSMNRNDTDLEDKTPQNPNKKCLIASLSLIGLTAGIACMFYLLGQRSEEKDENKKNKLLIYTRVELSFLAAPSFFTLLYLCLNFCKKPPQIIPLAAPLNIRGMKNQDQPQEAFDVCGL